MRPASRRNDHGWSLPAARVLGIPIRIHFTFILFLAWVLLSAKANGWQGALLVPGIFFCVVLHELGHALVAKRFGIDVRDITLYPIGGIAMLQGRRPKPLEEFWIALAGPAVNVVIAAILAPFALPRITNIFDLDPRGDLLGGLFVANVILPLFNLIPAFPMDGGRVLRAVLAMSMPLERATRIAGGIGQLLAMGFGLVGLGTGNVVLMLIAFFVFLGAGQEVSATVGISLVEGKRMSDAMVTEFETLSSGQNLQEASERLLAGAQQDFPVMVGDEVLGVLTRADLIRGLAMEGPVAYVAGHMRRDVPAIAPGEPLESAVQMLQEADGMPVFAMEGHRLVGMLTRENLSEFLMLEAVRRRIPTRG